MAFAGIAVIPFKKQKATYLSHQKFMANSSQSSSALAFPSANGTIYAEIIIPLALPKNFTWAIPPQMVESVQVGIRVEVVLGKHKNTQELSRRFLGKLLRDLYQKTILNILDKEPLIHPQQHQLWEWMSGYYMCTEGEVMQAALPANLKLSSESILIWNDDQDESFLDLDDEEYLVAEALELKKN